MNKPVALFLALSAAVAAHADEGQWQPHQLPQLQSELKRIGITIPDKLLKEMTVNYPRGSSK